MQGALVATLGRPDWWAMALAAFLVRGGVVIVALPILGLPTTAGLVTSLSPIVEGIVLGKPSLEGALLGSVAITVLVTALAGAALAGSWLDLALVRDATEDEDVDPGWRPLHASPWQALAIRLVAHVPTVLAIGYGFVRTLTVGYEEFTSPSDPGVAIVDRVLVRVPDVIVLVLMAWILGETVGSLAARRAGGGVGFGRALRASVQHVLGLRGLATLALTTAVVFGLLVAFMLAAGRAWEHLRSYLLDGANEAQLWSALVVLVATWILGLAIVGAGLAWRATAWTAEVVPD